MEVSPAVRGMGIRVMEDVHRAVIVAEHELELVAVFGSNTVTLT